MHVRKPFISLHVGSENNLEVNPILSIKNYYLLCVKTSVPCGPMDGDRGVDAGTRGVEREMTLDMSPPLCISGSSSSSAKFVKYPLSCVLSSCETERSPETRGWAGLGWAGVITNIPLLARMTGLLLLMLSHWLLCGSVCPLNKICLEKEQKFHMVSFLLSKVSMEDTILTQRRSPDLCRYYD